MKYFYQIGEISALCEIPFPVYIQKESIDFIRLQMDKTEVADLNICFSPVEELKIAGFDGHWELDRFYTLKSVYYCSSPQGEPYARIQDISGNGTELLCEYVKGKEFNLNYSRNLCDIIALETLLLNHHGVLLHSSLIRWNDQGILFSAPSGTGKSTQADLWVKYEGADIINGDRAGLRREDGGWNAYGLPYAGSSGIYRNESAPVRAVVVLRQAKENRIRPLRPAEAIRYLYPEVTIHHWDRDFTERAVNLLTDLVTAVPVYLLECLPDQGAVELTKRIIFENEGEVG